MSSTEHKYMYVIVRNDLSSAQRAVQSAHASIESGRKFLKPDEEHPSVIILIVKNENKLKKVIDELSCEHVVFREPDIGNQVTAVATKPLFGDEREQFKRFQLLY